MKRLWAVLCSVLLLGLVCMPVMAEETELTASVPYVHTVTIESAGGRIVSGDKVCGEQISVDRQDSQVYMIIPDPGKTLKRLLYNGTDVTDQVKNNRFTAPSLVRDAVLTAEYEDAAASPDENKYVISGSVVDKNGEKMPGVIVEIGGIMDTTDEDGCFKIEGLPSGVHSVVIKDKEGNILGYVSITINGQGDKELVLTADENGNPVLIPKYGTERIDATWMLTEDGSIKICDVRDLTSKPEEVSPSKDQKPIKNQEQTKSQEQTKNREQTKTTGTKTGDDSRTVLWILLACAGIFAAAETVRRKREFYH